MNRILSLLSDVLGEYNQSYDDNYIFYCPKCNHRKKKLSVNINNYKWNCWVCDDFKGRSLYSLFKRVGANDRHFRKLKEIVGDSKYTSLNYDDDLSSYLKSRLGQYTDVSERRDYVKLPSEYIPLWEKRDSVQWRRCMDYLVNERGLSIGDIKKHRLGYCEYGDFSRMVIIPNFDSDGNLNFFTGRSYDKSNYLKFRNPKGVNKSNIIGFEFYVDWKSPIVLVEGAFDAMSIKRQAVVSFGSEVHDVLKNKILRNKPPAVYVGLDPDAVIKSLHAINYFLSFGIDVFYVDYPSGEDPNSLGYEQTWDCIADAEEMNFDKVRDYNILSKLVYES